MIYHMQCILRIMQRFPSVDVLVCRRFGLSTFRFVDVSVCRRFGLSTFRSVDVLVCRRFGLSTFRFVDVSACRRFGLSTFRFVDVSVCRRFGCRRFGLSTFWLVIRQLIIRSHEVSNPQDWLFKLLHCFQFDRHIGSTAEMSIKFQSHWTISNTWTHLGALKLYDILW